jgi:hypothetical protein
VVHRTIHQRDIVGWAINIGRDQNDTIQYVEDARQIFAHQLFGGTGQYVG